MNDITRIEETVLLNRKVNIKEYCSLDDTYVLDFNLLPNIQLAVDRYIFHCNNKHNLHIVVDSDVDGFTSAALIYQYTKRVFPNVNITYSLHTGKQHGLTEDITIPQDTQLLIIPDAGSNDIEACKKLKQSNCDCDIIILDHHQIEHENPYAIVVNNQCNEYKNHELSGVGVAYKFAQAVDDYLWEDISDTYLDLVALGNIADMMDIRSYETKVLIEKGLKRINNNLFKALLIRQADSINGTFSIRNIQFYIVPMINALIRMGDESEKDLMFKAFVEQTEFFDYKPRNKPQIREDIYTRVVRLCYNAKQRQKKAIDKAMPLIDSSIEHNGLHDNVIFVNATNLIPATLTGIMAGKIAAKYHTPCLVLRQQKNVCIGSGRNCRNSYFDNLKEVLSQTNLFHKVSGHNNAFGVEINAENIAKSNKILNQISINKENVNLVDFIISADELSVEIVHKFEQFKQCCGQGIEEPTVVVKDLQINSNEFMLMGKQQNNWRCETLNGLVFVKFGIDPNTDALCNYFSDFESPDKPITINVIGHCGLNYYQGMIIPQFIIDDYEVV